MLYLYFALTIVVLLQCMKSFARAVVNQRTPGGRGDYVVSVGELSDHSTTRVTVCRRLLWVTVTIITPTSLNLNLDCVCVHLECSVGVCLLVFDEWLRDHNSTLNQECTHTWPPPISAPASLSLLVSNHSDQDELLISDLLPSLMTPLALHCWWWGLCVFVCVCVSVQNRDACCRSSVL